MVSGEQRSGAVGQLAGHVVAIQGATVTGLLLDHSVVGPAAVVIGDLVAMPTGAGRAYGIVHALRKGRRDGGSSGGRDPAAGRARRAARQAGVPPRRVGLPGARRRDRARDAATRPRLVYARPAVATCAIGHLRHDDDAARLSRDRRLAGQEPRHPRQHRLRQVLRGHGRPARAAGCLPVRHIAGDRPAQRVCGGAGRARAAARPVQSRAALLAADLRGDRRRPDLGRRGPGLRAREPSCAMPSCAPSISISARLPTPPTSPSTPPYPTACPTSRG